MIIATNQKMTLEEYLHYDDGTEARYELVDGVLVEMGAENDINILIEGFLVSLLLQFVPHYLVRRGTEIEVSGTSAQTRYPDLMVLTEAAFAALPRNQRSLLLRDMPAPQLVVKVVSPGEPGTPNYDRDYLEKPLEYAARGIPEYWIIDPSRQVVLVLTLVDEAYEQRAFQIGETLVSPIFSDLQLNAGTLLQGGQSG